MSPLFVTYPPSYEVPIASGFVAQGLTRGLNAHGIYPRWLPIDVCILSELSKPVYYTYDYIEVTWTQAASPIGVVDPDGWTLPIVL
jgi:hypothetical protein